MKKSLETSLVLKPSIMKDLEETQKYDNIKKLLDKIKILPELVKRQQELRELNKRRPNYSYH